jgi:hypothetical protein
MMLRLFGTRSKNWLLAIGMLAACSKSQRSAEGAAAARSSVVGSASAEVAPPAVAVRPRFGGNVVSFGDSAAEVMVHPQGLVEAVIHLQRNGVLQGGDTSLLVSVLGTGAQRHNVRLSWDAARARFVGHAEGGVQLRGGPVSLVCVLKGKTARGSIEAAAVLDGPRRGGHLAAVGPLGAEVKGSSKGDLDVSLWDGQLAAVTGEVGARVEALVKPKNGQPPQVVPLAWNPQSACFAGRLDPQSVGSPVEFELKVELKGKSYTGGLASLPMLTAAAHGGVVIAVGSHSVEMTLGLQGLMPAPNQGASANASPAGARWVLARWVHAFVADATGNADSSGKLALSLEVEGSPASEFEWNGKNGRYEGKVPLDVDLSSKQLRISLKGGQSGELVNEGGIAGLKPAKAGKGGQ